MYSVHVASSPGSPSWHSIILYMTFDPEGKAVSKVVRRIIEHEEGEPGDEDICTCTCCISLSVDVCGSTHCCECMVNSNIAL